VSGWSPASARINGLKENALRMQPPADFAGWLGAKDGRLAGFIVGDGAQQSTTARNVLAAGDSLAEDLLEVCAPSLP